MEYSANKAYLICYKGNASIFDKLIRIIKTSLKAKHTPVEIPGQLNIFPPPPRPPMPEEIRLALEINTDYTHVGIWVPSADIADPEEITYYACREDAGVQQYTESVSDVDIIEIKPKNNTHIHLAKFAEATKFIEGSMISDMGYRELRKKGTMSSVEWVAAALDLAFPAKYTINKLIRYANME